MELTVEEKNMLRGKGFIVYKDGRHFSCRVVINSANISAAEAKVLSDVCTKYGKGYFTLTQRGNVEIPWVKYENLENIAKDLAEVNLTVGATGPRPRPAQGCKGTVCRMGLFDTDEVVQKLNERFYKGRYNIKLPAKVRIQVSGCPNNCSKPFVGCIGIQGRTPKEVAIILGGMEGREVIVGKQIHGLYSIEAAMDIIEKALEFYQNNGQPGERFAKMIERIGFENIERALVIK